MATPSGQTPSDAEAIAVALFLRPYRERPVHGSTWLIDEVVSAAPL